MAFWDNDIANRTNNFLIFFMLMWSLNKNCDYLSSSYEVLFC